MFLGCDLFPTLGLEEAKAQYSHGTYARRRFPLVHLVLGTGNSHMQYLFCVHRIAL
jgi:hypothetical protein